MGSETQASRTRNGGKHTRHDNHKLFPLLHHTRQTSVTSTELITAMHTSKGLPRTRNTQPTYTSISVQT